MFPVIALALVPKSGVDTISSTPAPHTGPSSRVIGRSSMAPTHHQLQVLETDPQNAFLAASSSHVVLDYSDRELAAEARGILWAIKERPNELGLRHRIHQLTVDGWGSLANFSDIAHVLRLLERLDELHWKNNDPVPQLILSAIQKSHPVCKIFYNMVFSNWDTYDRTVSPIQTPGDEPNRNVRSKARSLIIGNANLHTFSTSIEYGGDPGPEKLRLVHRIITTCPNLRHLDLSIGHSGCVVSDGQPYAFDFSGLSALAKAPFAPLESLRLSRYNLDGLYNGDYPRSPLSWPDRTRLKWPWHYLPDFVLNNIPPPWVYSMQKDYEPPDPAQHKCPTSFNHTTNLDGWLERMDFSKLTSLDVGISPATLHKLRPVLTNLAILRLHGGDKCDAEAIEWFLSNTSVPLENLHLCNFEFNSFDNLLDVLSAKHNSSLTILDLHEHEEMREHSCWRREDESHPKCQNTGNERPQRWYDDHLYLHISQLQRLATSSPNMQTLDIDLDRNLSAIEQGNIFEALGSFKHLEKLTLRVESPTFQKIRNGEVTDRWFFSMDQKDLSDPLVNKTWVRSVFDRIRGAQFYPGEADSISPGEPGESSKLRELEVIVGPWSSRHQNGMVGPEKFVLGRFECVARPMREVEPFEIMDHAGQSSTAVEEDVECSGELRWPDEYMRGYWGGWDDEEVVYGDMEDGDAVDGVDGVVRSDEDRELLRLQKEMGIE